MGSRLWIFAILILIVLIIGGIYIYYNKENSQSQTYEACVEKTLNESRTYGPAAEELSGAKRTDNNGNIWVKQGDGNWKTSIPGFENTAWGDLTIDEQEGGEKYTPKVFPECEKYL